MGLVRGGCFPPTGGGHVAGPISRLWAVVDLSCGTGPYFVVLVLWPPSAERCTSGGFLFFGCFSWHPAAAASRAASPTSASRGPLPRPPASRRGSCPARRAVHRRCSSRRPTLLRGPGRLRLRPAGGHGCGRFRPAACGDDGRATPTAAALFNPETFATYAAPLCQRVGYQWAFVLFAAWGRWLGFLPILVIMWIGREIWMLRSSSRGGRREEGEGAGWDWQVARWDREQVCWTAAPYYGTVSVYETARDTHDDDHEPLPKFHLHPVPCLPIRLSDITSRLNTFPRVLTVLSKDPSGLVTDCHPIQMLGSSAFFSLTWQVIAFMGSSITCHSFY